MFLNFIECFWILLNVWNLLNFRFFWTVFLTFTDFLCFFWFVRFFVFFSNLMKVWVLFVAVGFTAGVHWCHEVGAVVREVLEKTGVASAGIRSLVSLWGHRSHFNTELPISKTSAFQALPQQPVLGIKKHSKTFKIIPNQQEVPLLRSIHDRMIEVTCTVIHPKSVYQRPCRDLDSDSATLRKFIPLWPLIVYNIVFGYNVCLLGPFFTWYSVFLHVPYP